MYFNTLFQILDASSKMIKKNSAKVAIMVLNTYESKVIESKLLRLRLRT